MSNSSQSTHPVGRVLWKELLILSSFTLKSEGETSSFRVLTVKSFCHLYGMQLCIWLGKYNFHSPTGRVLCQYMYMGCSYAFDWINIILTYYSLIFFIVYAFKGQIHVFAGRVKIVSHSSCRTSAILKYFCHLACMFDLILYISVNSYGHVERLETVSSPNHIPFLGKLEQAVYQNFVHILSLVTDNNPSWISVVTGHVGPAHKTIMVCWKN